MTSDIVAAANEYQAGSVRIGVSDGRLVVPCSAFTAEDYAVGLARAKEVYRPNKANARVLRMLEELIATAALTRVGTEHGWPVEKRADGL